MNDKLERIWKELAVALSKYHAGMSGGGEENHAVFSQNIPRYWPTFKPSTSQIQVHSITSRPASSVS
jgi:hypothetical protein